MPVTAYNSGTNGILSNPDSYQDFISVANVRRNWATERDVLSSMATQIANLVEWTDPAKQDLKSIHDYIARDSKFYAKKVSFEIVEKSEKLNIFPEIGRIVPEIGNPKIRELLIYSYIFLPSYLRNISRED